VSTFAFSLDGERLAYGAKDGAKYYVFVGKERGAPYAIAGNPVFSPDGARIAYIASPDRDKVHVVVNERKGPEYVGDSPVDLCFSLDGKKLAYVAVQSKTGSGAEAHVVVLDVTAETGPIVEHDYGPLNISVTSAQPLTAATLSAVAWSPVFSPDGQLVAYGVNGGPTGVIARPLRTMDPGRLYQIEQSIGSSAIYVNDKRAATVKVTGFVTPLVFSNDGKEITWMHLRDRKLYLRRLKLK
jgi:hypothetical protein